MRLLEFKEKLKQRRACEEVENAKANSSEVNVVEEAASSEKQNEEVIDGNAKIQPENPDHSQMNGEFESRTQNGECATTAPDEDGKSSILSTKSQSLSEEIITATNTEPALANGECNAVDEVMLVEKETPKN